MKLSQKDLKKYIIYPFIISVILGIVIMFTFKWGWYDYMERLTYDLRFKLRGNIVTDNRIIIVSKDEESKEVLKKRGGDFTRSYYGKLIENLTDWGATVIGLDFEFSHPVYQDPVQDDNFANSLDKSGRVVLARFIQSGKPVVPFDEFREVELGEAFINVTLDPDGTVRRLPLLELELGEDGKFHPYFAFGLELFLDNLYPPEEEFPEVKLSSDKNNIPKGFFDVGKMRFPDHMYINFAGPSGTFTKIPFWKVLKGKVDKNIFKNKIVLVGSTIPADHDFYKVPFSGNEKISKTKTGVKIVERGSALMSGIEVHANLINTLIYKNNIKRWVTTTGEKGVKLYWLVGGIVIFASLLFIFIPFHLFISLPIFLLGLISYLYLSYFEFTKNFFWLETFAPATTWMIIYFAGIIYHRYMEAKEKQFVEGTFGKYVSSQVVKELLKHPDLLTLGGQKKNITIFFSDIRSFTTLSEGMDPQDLVNFLNEYLTEMTNLAFEYDGVVDKYIGDAMMAFWGAPIDDPEHPVKACRSAIRMLEELELLNIKWKKEGRPQINIGIGINTADVTIGNMGSEARFDYTVMGDGVNLASRLEAINKQYKTRIIISQYTYELVKDKFISRMIDKVAVKGKKEPVVIYELISEIRNLPETKQKVLKLFEKGLSLYFKADMKEAKRYFAAALKLDPQDGPSEVFFKRCEELEKNPPDANWDGVFVMKTK